MQEAPQELTPEQCARLIWSFEEDSTALAGVLGTSAADAAYWHHSLQNALHPQDRKAAG